MPGPAGPPGAAGAPGAPGSTGSLFLDEITAINLSGSNSIGVPGTIPFGVGPYVPSGQDFVALGAAAYNPLHSLSGSFM
jgi:hypothetical protein